MAKSNGSKIVRKIFKWICTVFLLSGALVYMPSFASVIFALLGAVLIPIKPIEKLINKVVPGKKILKGIVAFVIFVIACNMAPQSDMTSPEDLNGSTISTEAVIERCEDSVTDAVEGSISEMTEESVTEMTQELETVEESVVELNTESTEESIEESAASPTINSTFEVHFIDVGQADAVLVLCDGKAMLIDGGNAEDSSLIYSYLKKMNITHLDYVIGSHVHEDHIGGIAGALNFATVDTVYCPMSSYDDEVFNDFLNTLNKLNVDITIPKAGDSFMLGSASCTVLAVNIDSSNINNTSIVLRIVYGETSFLFTGDAEREVEQEILGSGVDIQSTVLKVGHHGAESSTSYAWLYQVMPEYAVISVGEDNSYGHPTEEVLSRLRDAEVKTYRTDMQGDIIVVSDGNNVTVNVEKNADADTLEPIVSLEEKIDKIVSDSCYNYSCKANRILAGTLTYKVLSENEVELTYDISEMIYTDTEYLVDDVMEEILNYIIADIDRSALSVSVTVYINANYEITEGDASNAGGEIEETVTLTEDNGRDYVVNTNTDKFHYPSCSSVKKIKESNRWDYHGTREELINMGYDPCKNCNP